ncbi:serine--tRNA ligase [Kaistia sp. 32K]|uniref:serine--tRNA ligase n=1 Tax=Kaistia sp. 32K TaxID=2795690 RepID=UPI0019157937|nr:serine--tRNA ligase [Kaistia sp. 32K]BCP53174.1 serine--tRNA ligase [Kaistia sp. 32K]
MLDIKWIRENPEALDRALASRGAEPISSTLIALDEARRAHIVQVQAAQERRNAASKEIGKAKGAKDEETAQRLMAEVATLKEFLSHAEDEERRLNKELDDALAVIPNAPLEDVPFGKDEADNVPYFGRNQTAAQADAARPKKREHSFVSKEHFEIGEGLGLMDFEAAAKLSGSRFVVLKGQLARLERAIGQFMLDLHTTEHGYTEVQPPLLVKDAALFGTGQLPKFKEDQYFSTDANSLGQIESFVGGELDRNNAVDPATLLERVNNLIRSMENAGFSDATIEAAAKRAYAKVAGEQYEFTYRRSNDEPNRFWLIPTAEVPLTNLVRESILDEKELPLRFTALTPCFRSEAGSAGRDTRGMLRQHQFNKVELVSITTPETSIDEHERMLACAEEVLKRLDLHYRVMTLCTGDMGFGSRKTYDIEVWLPGQNTYREISSVSVCDDFQARRMNARYRPGAEKGTRFVHTLNGSGTAVGRALIAVIENYQNEDGSITVPSALKPYMGGLDKVGAA